MTQDTLHGAPCWYELTTGNSAATQGFYGPLLDWAYADAGIPGFDYTLAKRGAAMIAGFYAPFEGQPEAWLVYFVAENVDDSVDLALSHGATLLQPANDVPGTGRFAILADPQGAAFGLFQPLPGQPPQAFGTMAPGFACWHELTCPDPQAALAFYGALLGWTPSTVMPMGEAGGYHLFAQAGADIGGIMPPQAPGLPTAWMPYFGVASAAAAAAQITAGGGTVTHGPIPVPGGAHAVMALDPQGAAFGLVGGA